MALDDKLLKAVKFGGGDNVGGIQHTQIFAAKTGWFTAIQKVKNRENAATNDELVVISTDHTFNVGYGFVQITAIPKTGNIESASAGDLDGKVKNDVFAFAVAGSKVETLAFEREWLNEDTIFLVKEVDGTIRQIGTEEIPARVETSTHSLGGGGFDGGKKTSFEIHGWGAGSAPIYTGAITLMP